MADFKAQRGVASMAGTVTSVTITAGVDYDAPSSITKALCYIVASNHAGDGSTYTFGQADDHTAHVSNQGNLLTSITFTRTTGTAPINIQWEILEYTGSAGGVNEFKVLGSDVVNFTTESSLNTSAWTPTDDNDVVGFITGAEVADTGASRAGMSSAMCTTDWDNANNYITVTRDETQYDSDISVTAIEFTGSNWTIQRIAHSFTAADTDETESMTAIGALTEAFMHVQHRMSDRSPADIGFKAWFTSTSEITFRTDEVAGTQDAVAWVIENPDLVVQHVSGSWASSVTDPDTDDVTVTTVDSMAETTIQGVGCTTGGNSSDDHQYVMGARLTSTSNVQLSRGISDQPRDYKFSVVQLPTAAGGATPYDPIYNYYYRALMSGGM